MGALYTWCPGCGRDYDEIDYEYQICHYCGWMADEKRYARNNVTPLKKRSPKKRAAGTNYQREIFIGLFAGGHVGKYGNRYRLWDRKKNPLRRFSISTFIQIKKFCRQKDGGWVVDLSKVRALRKNTWLKRYYTSLKNK